MSLLNFSSPAYYRTPETVGSLRYSLTSLSGLVFPIYLHKHKHVPKLCSEQPSLQARATLVHVTLDGRTEIHCDGQTWTTAMHIKQ